MSSRTKKKKLDAPCFVFPTLYNYGQGLLGKAHSCTFGAPIAMPGCQRRSLSNNLICLVVLVTAMSMLPALLLCRMAHWSILGVTNCNGWRSHPLASTLICLVVSYGPCHCYEHAFCTLPLQNGALEHFGCSQLQWLASEVASTLIWLIVSFS